MIESNCRVGGEMGENGIMGEIPASVMWLGRGRGGQGEGIEGWQLEVLLVRSSD